MKKILILFLAVLVFQPCFAFDIKKEKNNMTREEISNSNYELLFNSNPKDTDFGTDAEFMEILRKYIFCDIFSTGNLDVKTRELITVTSLSVQQTLPQLKAHINAAINVGVKPDELIEAIYQCAPFIGFPKTLNAVGVLNQVLKERGLKFENIPRSTTTDETRYDKGYEIQNPLYGDEIAQTFKDLPDDMGKDVAKFLTEFCFGDIYTRKGLDIKTRELLSIVILTTAGNYEQLKSHVAGALKANNTKEEITAAIIQCMPYVGFPKAFEALKIVKNSVK